MHTFSLTASTASVEFWIVKSDFSGGGGQLLLFATA